MKNLNLSSSLLAETSALIYVSPSTSFTPPNEPHASPAPKPSNVDNSSLYLINPLITSVGLSLVEPFGIINALRLFICNIARDALVPIPIFPFECIIIF